jgi:protocatechuate 3,4-dioxygenase beta subunit
MRTNEKGEYKFFTLLPASYPDSKAPKHIHVTVKEPGMNEYWIDEILFDDDPFLTTEEKSHVKGRGGNGIIKTKEVEKDFLKAQRDIILGKNIPNYPGK